MHLTPLWAVQLTHFVAKYIQFIVKFQMNVSDKQIKSEEIISLSIVTNHLNFNFMNIFSVWIQ